MADEPTLEELAALRAYARANGRHWKSRLRFDWKNGRVDGTLRRMRNTRGPSWLEHFKFPEEDESDA